MSLIEITVSSEVPCSVEQVYAALWHWEKFSEWWPTRVTFTGEALLVQPLPLVTIQMMRRPSAAPRRVVYDYVTGPFRGAGEWSIHEHPNGAHVDYTIRLNPVNALVAIGAATPVFRWKHRRDILSIMNRICAA